MDETGRTSDEINAGIVWVGYGIDAPEFHWNDYKDIDVRGKVLLMMVNEPPSDDPNFSVARRLPITAAGPTSMKRRRARARSASAYPQNRDGQLRLAGGAEFLVGRTLRFARRSRAQAQLASWIQLEIARKLAEACGMNLDEMMAAAKKPGFRAIPLSSKLQAHIRSKVRPFESNNVIARVDGSDASFLVRL